MLEQYPAIYRDAYGEEHTSIVNDGKLLRMVVRGVEFSDTDFDGFEPASSTDSAHLGSFTLYAGCLCACNISWDMPLPVAIGNEIISGRLHVYLRLGAPRSDGNVGIDSEDTNLILSFGGRTFTIDRAWDAFEDALNALQAMLPEGTYVKACINCAFSDYSPYGHGLFGHLACFRGHKEEYRAVRGKSGLFRLWEYRTEFVQETSLCPEFERRTPGAGYRG